MTINPNPYAEIIETVTAAGFFVSGPHCMEESSNTWHRIIAVTKRRPEGGFTGNSFWISFTNNEWYIGTWGGWLYQIENPENLAGMTIEWLSHNPDSTLPCFDEWLIDKYGLSEVGDGEFASS